MMDERKPKRLIVVAALCATVVLSGFIWQAIESRNTILRNGTEIVVKTRPIDPRDLLRGRYVQLQFDAEALPAHINAVPSGPVAPERGSPIYVYFNKGADGFDTIEQISMSRPSDMTGWMRARVDTVRFGIVASVSFPIDRYYANEHVAPEIERQMREGALTEVVLALHEGAVQIKAFRQNGQTVMVEPLY